MISRSIKIENEVGSLVAFLPDGESAKQRLIDLGRATILTVRDADNPLLGSKAEDDLFRSTIFAMSELMDEVEQLFAEITLLASGDAVDNAEKLLFALHDLMGKAEELYPSLDVSAAFTRTRQARSAFQESARAVLGVRDEPQRRR